MSLAPFFDRVYGAVGGHLSISRDSLNQVLGDITLGIRCGDNLSKNDLWIAELCINLAARLYPRLSIHSSSGELKSRLQDLATAINPDIEFSDNAPDFTSIVIGTEYGSEAIYPAASGWVASVKHSPNPLRGPSNPFAAGTAASIAIAEMFKRIFLKDNSRQDKSISLLKFDENTGSDLVVENIEIGHVLFAGLGAVGNGGLWALSRIPVVEGTAWLIDDENVELSNLQRYVLTRNADVGKSKVSLAKVALKGTGIKIKEKRLRLEEFAEESNAFKIPTTVVSVDNVSGRRAAQALLPKLVVNGWTSDQALGVSWHEFSRDAACLACLYHPHRQGTSAIEQAAKALGIPIERTALLWVSRQPLTDADIQAAAMSLGVNEKDLGPWRGKPLGDLYTDVVCGAVPLDVTGLGKVETVPLAHQSALAGILMGAELVKRTSPQLARLSQAETLISWDNVLKNIPAIWTKPRAREPGCICGDKIYQSTYQGRWLAKISPK